MLTQKRCKCHRNPPTCTQKNLRLLTRATACSGISSMPQPMRNPSSFSPSTPPFFSPKLFRHMDHRDDSSCFFTATKNPQNHGQNKAQRKRNEELLQQRKMQNDATTFEQKHTNQQQK